MLIIGRTMGVGGQEDVLSVLSAQFYVNLKLL